MRRAVGYDVRPSPQEELPRRRRVVAEEDRRGHRPADRPVPDALAERDVGRIESALEAAAQRHAAFGRDSEETARPVGRLVHRLLREYREAPLGGLGDERPVRRRGGG